MQQSETRYLAVGIEKKKHYYLSFNDFTRLFILGFALGVTSYPWK
jgi:hypothetical protein